MYNINLHAHTYFSDGRNSPLKMAEAAVDLGFSALVITDHYYGNRGREFSLCQKIYKTLRVACMEAKRVLPVIVGIELAFGKEEMLVFGSATIQEIMRHVEEGNELTLDLLMTWKKRHNSAFILCHPQDSKNWRKLLPILDGYERYNSGNDFFEFFDNDELKLLEHLPNWCNSDAHHYGTLCRGYNIVDSKIEDEVDLIKYIKKGKQPIHYRGEE